MPDYWILSPFVIDDNGNGDYTWAEAAMEDWCRGSGTWNDPYLIKNVIINCNNVAYGIYILNSDVYFRIENCTIFNAGEEYFSGHGIRLEYVTNGELIGNNCSFNSLSGIYLFMSSNSSIVNNVIIGNGQMGISSSNSNYTQYNGNILIDNFLVGLYIHGQYNTFSNNLMYGTGFLIFPDSMEYYTTEDVDTTNLFDDKPIYFYSNEVGLSSDDFINAGQILLYNCNDSLISNLDLTKAAIGVYMVNCHNNFIQGNSISEGIIGVYLAQSNYIVIKNNNITSQQSSGIHLDRSNFTIIIDNNIENTTSIGISIYGSSDGIISDNNLAFNMRGIDLQSSTNYLIYLNSFIQNDDHASDYGFNNNWDNGTIGNYWDDYNGVDYNDDGIGDSPYYIVEWLEIVDNFPIWDDGPGAPDFDPPVTTISLEGTIGNNDWYISQVLVTLISSDDISGINYTEYSYDGINWINYTGAFSIFNEGITTLNYRSIDNAGNIESTLIKLVKIDNSYGETTIELIGEKIFRNWHEWDTLIVLSANDTYSGISRIEYSFDGIHWTIYETPFNAPTSGIVSIYYRSVDFAGNIELQNSITIKVLYPSFIIDNYGGGDYTWYEAVNEGLCTGVGTLNNPYIIENMVIDAQNLGSGIEIRNSNAHFIIRNCTIFNSSMGSYPDWNAGIKLVNTNNGIITNNNCSNNIYAGIKLYMNSNNNLIVGNIANYNSE
jgi:parallel beta-helix repeat protein